MLKIFFIFISFVNIGLNIALAEEDEDKPEIEFIDGISEETTTEDIVIIKVTDENPQLESYKYVLTTENECNEDTEFEDAKNFNSEEPIKFNDHSFTGKYLCVKASDEAKNIAYLSTENTFNIEEEEEEDEDEEEEDPNIIIKPSIKSTPTPKYSSSKSKKHKGSGGSNPTIIKALRSGKTFKTIGDEKITSSEKYSVKITPEKKSEFSKINTLSYTFPFSDFLYLNSLHISINNININSKNITHFLNKDNSITFIVNVINEDFIYGENLINLTFQQQRLGNPKSINLSYSEIIYPLYKIKKNNTDTRWNRAEAVNIVLNKIDSIPTEELKKNQKSNFNDIDENSNDWFVEPVLKGEKAEIIIGYGNGDFRPEDKITKVETLAMMARGLKIDINSYSEKTSFIDVPTYAWFAKYVSWSKDANIFNETGEYFTPNKFVSKEEFIKLLDFCYTKNNIQYND